MKQEAGGIDEKVIRLFELRTLKLESGYHYILAE
jgi:hypothetical protein